MLLYKSKPFLNVAGFFSPIYQSEYRMFRRHKQTKPKDSLQSKARPQRSEDEMPQRLSQSPSLNTQNVLYLQGIIGNQAVQRYLDGELGINANDSLVQRNDDDLLLDDLGNEGFSLLDDEEDVDDGSGENEEHIEKIEIGSKTMIELKKGYKHYIDDRKEKSFVRNHDARFLPPPPVGWEYQFFEEMSLSSIGLDPVTDAAKKERKKLRKQEDRQWDKEEKADIKRLNKEEKEQEKQEKKEAKQEKKEDKEFEKQEIKETLEEAEEVLDKFDDVLSQNIDTEIIISSYRSVILYMQAIGDLNYPKGKKKKIIKKHSEKMRTILESHWDTYRELFQEDLGITSPLLVWLTNEERKDILKKINKGKSKKQAKHNFNQIYDYSGKTKDDHSDKYRSWYDSPSRRY